MDSNSYSEAVGKFLRDYRRAHGLTLDAVASAGRQFGASWRLSSVQSLEAGKASPTVPTLLTLALALGSLTGEPLKLSDLLGSARRLDRPSIGGEPVPRDWVDGVLGGERVVAPGELPHPRMRFIQPLGQGEPTEVVQKISYADFESMIDRGATQAEYRAARQLDVDTSRVQRQAMNLWSRPLDSESAHRAGPDATPQKRGRVTRVLIEELRAALKELE